MGSFYESTLEGEFDGVQSGFGVSEEWRCSTCGVVL